MVNALVAAGAVCIDLIGEYWQIVPPLLFGYSGTISQSAIILTPGIYTPKTTGQMAYDSDVSVGGQIYQVGVKIETDPVAFSSVVAPPGGGGCVGTLTQQVICNASLFSPRHGVAIGQSSFAGALQNSLFKRKVPIALRTAQDIKDCLSLIQGVAGVQCVGYQGESIPRIDLLIGTAGGGSNTAAGGAGTQSLVGVP